MLRFAVLLSVSLIAAAGCVQFDISDKCDVDNDCENGQVCRSPGLIRQCYTPCKNDDECPKGETCNGDNSVSDGVCFDDDADSGDE